MIADRPLRALPRPAALVALLLTIAALIGSVWAIDGAVSAPLSRAEGRIGDVALYETIHARVRAGESYYAAAVAEQRAHNYPTRPFITVRSPVLAWGDRLFGNAGWRAIAVVLLLGNVLAWTAALAGRTSLAERAGFAALLTASGTAAFLPLAGLVHEVVAGLALSLALALYRTDRYGPSWLLAALAIAVRDIALPFVLLWLALALTGRRWREAAAIGVLLGLFAVGMAFHAQAVAGVQPIDGLASPGWAGLQGPGAVLAGLWRFSPLMALPAAWAAPLAVLALLGWLGLGGRTARFAGLWFVGMIAGIALFARQDNVYWVQLLLPTYLAGLALAPRALVDLAANALGKP